ncbi:hypothetical protein Taro_023184, partial [Colocasia esculenta]|nr:hypothetical protein [Colocasia esculenta]
MPWWNRSGGVHSSSARSHSAQSPSSESSSPQCSSESASPTRRQRRDFGMWSRRDMHHQQPRLTRQRKLRHLTTLDMEAVEFEGLDRDVRAGEWGSSTSVTRSASSLESSPAVRFAGKPGTARLVHRPQPLPLPEKAGYQLPSPEAKLGRGVGEEGSGTSSSSLVEPTAERLAAATPVSRLAYHTLHKGNEHVDVAPSGVSSGHKRMVFQDQSATDSIHFRLIAPPSSAPTSGLSSPALSPRRLSIGDFFPLNPFPLRGPVTWSAPEFPSLDIIAGYSTQNSPEKSFPSPDHSPLYSPTVKSPGRRSRTPSSPPSPLHPKNPEPTAAWPDSNNNVNVHPLPLPPGGLAPVQPPFSLPTAPKHEAASMTNQWQKGKLIGSGTFGNVYQATHRHTGALCAMKEVNLISDDPKSAECIKQLEQ